MYKAKVNNNPELTVELGKDNLVNGQPFHWDVLADGDGRLHIIKEGKSYNADVVSADYTTKSFVIKINNNTYTVALKDKFDALLKDLGMDNMNVVKVNEIKAPMPGLVVSVLVNEGDSIKKGDGVLVLEAMKMENILKSPTDAIVKKINIVKGDKVEKNQVLIHFS